MSTRRLLMSGLPSVTLATASNGLGKDKVTFPLFLLSLYTTLLAPFPCSYFFYSYTCLYSPRTRIPTHPHEFESKDDSLNKLQKFPQAWTGNSPGGCVARVRQNPVGKSYCTGE